MAQYGVGTFPASLSFVSAIWGVVLPHLYTGGCLRVAGSRDLDAWLATMEADRSTYTWLPSPLVAEFTDELARRPTLLRCLQTVVHTGAGVRRSLLEALVDETSS